MLMMMRPLTTGILFFQLLLFLIISFPLGTLLLMQMFGMPIPLERVSLIITGTGITTGLARTVVDAAYWVRYKCTVGLFLVHVLVVDCVLCPGYSWHWFVLQAED